MSDTPCGNPPLSWHQIQAMKRRYATRNDPAHLRAADWLRTGLFLCGLKDDGGSNRVYLSEWAHRHKPENKACRKCCAEADRLERLKKEGQTT